MSFPHWSIESIFLYLAVPASLVLIAQTLLSILGIGGETDSDIDLDSDGDLDGDSDGDGEGVASFSFLSLFSLRNLVAFFTFFGWGGLWLLSTQLDTFIVVILASVIGACFVAISSGAFYLIAHLQRSGTLVLKDAIGKCGEVYLPIPANNQGFGKVSIVLQGALRELDAITEEPQRLKTGTPVRVIGISKDNQLIVTSNASEGEAW